MSKQKGAKSKTRMAYFAGPVVDDQGRVGWWMVVRDGNHPAPMAYFVEQSPLEGGYYLTYNGKDGKPVTLFAEDIYAADMLYDSSQVDAGAYDLCR